MINTKALRPIQYTDLVRIGRPNDGGYVVPRKIFSLCDGLLSYGINKDWSFERAFWNKNPNANDLRTSAMMVSVKRVMDSYHSLGL